MKKSSIWNPIKTKDALWLTCSRLDDSYEQAFDMLKKKVKQMRYKLNHMQHKKKTNIGALKANQEKKKKD